MKRVTLLFLATVSLLVLSACGNEANTNRENDISSESIDVSRDYEDYTEEELAEMERQAIEKILEGNNIDKSILDEKNETKNGATVLGSAKPVEQFRTLHDGENHYNSYFGFHNNIDTLPEHTLTGLYCIDHDFLQGIYETESKSKILVVKLSTTLSTEELREPYTVREHNETIKILDNQEVYIEYEDEAAINLALISYRNGKSYSIYCADGLSKEEVTGLAIELTENVMSMDDWE